MAVLVEPFASVYDDGSRLGVILARGRPTARGCRAFGTPRGCRSQSRPRGRRKPKSEFEARRVIHHLDTSPMETGDGSDKAEAEPVAWSAATLFQPIKTLEDFLAFIYGGSGSIIGD